MKRLPAIALLIAGLLISSATHDRAYANSKSASASMQTTQQPAKDAGPGNAGAEDIGAESYANHCAICHGDQREGIAPAFPPLAGVGRHLTDSQIAVVVRNGKGRMPGFPKLQPVELTALIRFLGTPAMTVAGTGAGSAEVHPSELSAAGRATFQQNCAFCHGRDAMGGETGADLTRSKLVLADVKGDRISEVVRNGRPEKKMPAFNFSNEELLGLSTFIHDQVTKAAAQKGGRRGVDVADLQSGNTEAGKRYFNGAGTCAKCHSATGDLAGIASRYEGLQLEERMLYPHGVKSKVSVTLPSGEKVTGTLAYRDEFTVALRDANGDYRSWFTSNVTYKVDAPVQAHVDLFSKYTDDDIHNLMAYLQTLR